MIRRFTYYSVLLCLALQCVTSSLRAQDVHFSQFFNVPGNYNPADAGRFDGDYRVASVYRNQWRTVTVPFQTFGLSADANKLIPKRPIGTGLAFFRDQAGDGKFTTTQLNLSGSYLLPFLKDTTQNISLGLQMGLTNKSIDFDALEWGNQFDGVFQYNDKLVLKPALNLSSQGRFSELILGGYARYDLTEPKGVRQEVGAGLFYRSGDAGYVYFDVIYDQWQAGVSYDFNFSDLRVASNGRGGVEFTLIYIFKKFRPRIVGGRVCPDFI